MKISLVIPAYNEEKYIGDCLKSVTRAASGIGELFEIIVVDNACTDRTTAIAKSFPNVRVVVEKEKGLTKARQRGLAEARGDIIAYVDADTLMPEDWFRKLVAEFSGQKDLVCLSGPYWYYDLENPYKLLVEFYWRFLAMPFYYLTGCMATGGNFVAKKESLEAVGGFDTTISFYGEDTDIARRLRQKGKVKFTMSFPIETSARRLKGEGVARIGFIYALNYLSEVFFHRPITKSYKDIR